MHSLHYFTDRSYLSCLDEPTGTLVEAMRRKGIIAPDHHRVRFCGFFSWRGGTAVFLPANSDVSEKPALSAHWLLRTLSRYYAGRPTGIQGTEGDSLIGGTLLSLAVTLFDDYQANGLYVRRSRYSIVNQGKTNWPRTISRHTPFPSVTAPVYLELESSKTHYVSDCETARIHAAVVRDIREKFGILLYGETILSDETLEKMPPPAGVKEVQIAYLNRELSLSYSERDITLINSLKRYIDSSQGSDENSLIIGTRYFHSVWEVMLDNALSSERNFNSRLPVPYYQKDGLFHEVAEKGQRTDTVLRNDDGTRYAVVDAKYYTASAPKDAPGWPDLVKQFFYQKAVKSVTDEDAEVTTHFVFPGSDNCLTSAHVGKRGQHQQKTLQHTPGYPVVHCHYCDPIELMKAYVTHGRMLHLRDSILNTSDTLSIT
ncbi:LlaJI family restriction endonuclease [Vibrio vulnificus]|uniref:LlaJI family restriction endonuclease n=1 Tax=Vibrio vulnificus TaxID=672 RepID=UPI003EDA57B1